MFSFSTKANTLEILRNSVSKSTIVPSYIFSYKSWLEDKHKILKDISCFTEGVVIVRSSAVSEDNVDKSCAGMYTSVPNVLPRNMEQLEGAIHKVFESYVKNGGYFMDDQVFVQPMITDISMSGVIFTQDITTGAPYYVINYDDISGRFDSVTAGDSDVDRTLIVRREYISSVKSSRFIKLLLAVKEIELLTQCVSLDIEFIVDANDIVYILQVRPIAARQNWNRSVSKDVNVVLEEVKDFVKERMQPIYGSYGCKTVLGIMPDWNPVEMLGAAPRRLAVSLYRYLITDSIWAEARATMGYRDMCCRPLMFSLGGRQYIDVRESFNSFLPKDLSLELCDNIVDGWIAHLVQCPELHDKVEFEVAVTVHTPDFATHVVPQRLGHLPADALVEFEKALKELTCTIIGGNILEESFSKVEILTMKYQDFVFSNMAYKGLSALYGLQNLLKECKENGTKPFSILARCAFMAESMLRALVNCKVLSTERAAHFRASIKTVLSDFLDDVKLVSADEMEESVFLERYGHLRPSSYDILSLRYDQRPLRFAAEGPIMDKRDITPFILTQEEELQINKILVDAGYTFDACRLFTFMNKAITGRESAKFEFSKYLSRAIEVIAVWGEHIGLARKELAHLDIKYILDAMLQVPFVGATESYLRTLAESSAKDFSITQALKLPFLIVDVTDVDVVPLLKSRPNYITSLSVQADVVLLTGNELRLPHIRGKIVLIEGADPGFDWIFAQGIVGLITKYGGANSHMAIRCAELNIPAAIGCGEQLFARFSSALEIKLDCMSEHISIC